ncbi:MAG: dihydropteroate synthase [Chthoniobacter sp.]
MFDFVAHPDLPKKFGFRPEGDLRRFYEPAIAALAETKTPFEINTAGWRKDCREQYPAREFIELAAAAGVPLLINSDSHAVEDWGRIRRGGLPGQSRGLYADGPVRAAADFLRAAAVKLVLRDVAIEFPVRPLVMGIVNLVADSFSGDGITDIDAALARAGQQLADGADIIDIGAESARTNRGPIPEEEEAAQLRRFVERWPELCASRPSSTPRPLLSINAWRPGVIRQVLPRAWRSAQRHRRPAHRRECPSLRGLGSGAAHHAHGRRAEGRAHAHRLR